MIRVGLIGCGGIAPGHISAYKSMDDVEVVALCDLDIERVNYVAKKFSINKTYTDYWDMIDSNELDLIDVCTPITTHAHIVCDIAKSVPSILLEKPMALTVSECDKIIDVLKKYGTKCCINHLQLFSPHIQKVKSFINNGEIDLFSLKTTQKESYELLNSNKLAPDWNVSRKHGGIIWEVCAHLGYLQLYFLPDITEVYALGGNTKYEVYDNFSVLLKTKSDKFGLIELNWVSKETEIVYEFTDVNGERLKIHRDYNYLSKHYKYPPINIPSVMNNMIIDESRLLKKWLSFGRCYVDKGKIKPMSNMIREYVSSLINEQPPPVTPEDGRNTVNLLECIRKSLDEKQPVSVKNF